MDFFLTDEQQQLRKTIRDFAAAEMAPHVMEWDEASAFPSKLIPKLAELGLLGVIFPEQYGGAGLGYVEYALAIEELARVDGSVGLIVAAHNSLCTNHIYKFGTEEQRQKYVVPLARGEKLGCWALTEPQSGSDASGTRTVAVREGDCWRLDGTKTFTTNGHYADICVAMAVTEQGKGAHGISAFIVEKGTPGFSRGQKRKQAGHARERHFGNGVFAIAACPLPTCWARRAKASSIHCRCLTGDASRSRRCHWEWRREPMRPRANTQKSGNSLAKPSRNFEAIQFKLADMATEIAAARLLVYHAASVADCSIAHTGAEGGAPRFTLESSMAKLYASEVAVRVANEAVQVFGGYGFVKDYPAEKFYRDVKLCTIGEGTSEIQRLVIARQILEKTT